MIALTFLLTACSLLGGNKEEEETEHKHSFTEWVTHREATCTEEGLEKSTCSCGEIKFRHVSAKGHTPVVDEAYEPTWVQEGKTKGTHCSVCGEILTPQEAIAPTGRHVYGEDNKCTMCGAERPCTYGLTFTLNKKGTEYTVTASDGSYDDVVVPAEYDYIPVTEIAANVFEGQQNLKSVVVSEGVKNIKEYAFKNCTSLKSIVIPDSVEHINSYILAGCSSLEEMTIPFVGYKEITGNYEDYQYPLGVFFGRAAFENAEATEQRYYYKEPENYDTGSSYVKYKFYIPKSLKKVVVTKGTPAGGAFMNCKNLEEVVLPQGITSIKTYVFYGCTWIKSFVIPDSVTEVQMKAFENCTNMTRMTLGQGIGRYSIMNDKDVFKGCYKLVEIYNRSRITLTPGSTEYSYLAYYAKNIVTRDSSTNLSTSEGYPVYTDGEDVVLLGSFDAETTVMMPNDITIVNKYAFCNDTDLISVTLSDSVKTIEAGAFSGCENADEIIVNTTGWFVCAQPEDETGEAIDLSDPATAAELLTTTYANKYIKR